MQYTKIAATIAIAASFSTFSADANACSCPRWSASEWIAATELAVVAEVVSVGSPQKIKGNHDSEIETVVPFTFKVIEQLKGPPPANEEFFLVGPPSSCELRLQAGSRVALLLKKPQRVVGYCSAMSNQLVGELRQAANANR